MAELINAKCPNCGAILELPEKLDRAFCMHCGGKVIIAKDEFYHHKASISCPDCKGKGSFPCIKEEIYPFGMMYAGFETLYDTKTVVWKESAGTIFHIKATGCDKTGRCFIVPLVSFNSQFMDYKANTYYNEKGNYLVGCRNGKCLKCKGTGEVGIFSKKTCELCRGTGKCPICNGSGICTLCNETGKVKCETCNGTGFKVYKGE